MFPFAFALFLSVFHVSQSGIPHMVCYYDAAGSERDGVSKFTTNDMEYAFQFCTHLVYGYVGLDSDTLKITTLNHQRDVLKRHIAEITDLKDRYPHIKFLLSLGGDYDIDNSNVSNGDNSNKYMRLLEADAVTQQAFVQSAREIIRNYNFDGLDLAFQWPKNKPRKAHNEIGTAWKSVKKLFTEDYIVDPKADEHKEQFVKLVTALKEAFRNYHYMLTLTVLPNVNTTWHYDIPALINNLNYITLAAFDFTTPERNPEEADYTAPLYELPIKGNRLPFYNVDYQVDYWLTRNTPYSKIIVGVPSYGRTWKMTKSSGKTGTPIVGKTDGPAPGGPLTKTSGLLSYTEICERSGKFISKIISDAGLNTLQRFSDRLRQYGPYAFRPANNKDEPGIWISYANTDSTASKASYVKKRNLGGVALFDITLDDFRGQCMGEKFPLLRGMKYRLF